jgi:hypothetical protein
MSSSSSRTALAASLVGAALVALSGVGSLGACSGGVVNVTSEGGSEGGLDPDASGPSCTPRRAPASAAIGSVALKFATIDTGGKQNAWKTIGYDRDGLCTTQLSKDVCQRAAGADSSKQLDGVDGIDNAYGHSITPFLAGLGSTEGAGYLTTDGSGKGTLILDLNGNRFNVPVTLTQVDRQGTTATVSAIIPVEDFVTEMSKSAGRISPQLCGGSTLDSIKQTIRQAADILLDGMQNTQITCNAITLGATLGGVSDGTPPVVPPSPDPCK